MPLFDLICSNGHEQIDIWANRYDDRPTCPICGQTTDTLWRSPAAVIGDDIPGGVEIRHGLCNEDGSPRKYYSKSEINREAKRRGLRNHVEHVTPPGTDKSKHTTRWT